ncbi:MAG: hypothetical protein KDB88_13490, partial [Flavobacteriales bacterium]|nr:hypothetical protein [Flavobacteriales bacterium]
MLHRLRNYMLYPLIALATGIMLLMAVGVAYEDEVKARLITAVNAHLNAPVSVQDIDLTLIRRFPNASLHLHNVLVQEAYPGSTLADTLLHAQDLYLEFALFDLFGGSYTIDHIHADRVVAYPRHNADGLANYTIWGSDSTAETTAIDLRMISFEDLFLRYRHEGNVLDLKFHAQSLALSGSFSGSLNTLHAAGDVELLDWSQHGSSLLAQRRTEVDLHMDLGAGDAPFRITNGEVKADGMSLTTTLSVSPDDRGTHIDLRAAGDRIELETLFAQLPRSLTDPLKRYGMAGESDVVIHYSGTIGEGLRPTLQVDLALRAARFSEQGSGTTFKGVHGWLEATINGQGDLEKLVIRELKASTGSGSLKADLELRAGSKGSIKGGLKADLAFGDLLRFAQIDTLEQAEGRLRADLKFDGPFSEPGRYGVREMRQLRLSGTATLDKAAIKMKGIRHRVTDLHAELVLNGADVRLVGMHADVQGSRIALEGSLRNLVPYVLVEQERLEIEAAASSD